MKGDFSRSTYRPANRYSSVRLQQGRVLLDAEWNEQADIVEHVDRTTTSDVIGETGAPRGVAAAFTNFAVAITPDGKDLSIAPGEIYVDGVLCENHGDGVLYSHQPDLPGAWLPDDNADLAVYLDVWERHVTAVDQFGAAFPPLLESALQGPDTATRTRVVWQVKLQPVSALDCAAFTPPPASTGRLRASEVPPSGPAEDCLVPPGGGYRRLENQLYRVEVHAIEAGTPLIKWSRDNGSIVSRVKSVDEAALTLVVEDGGRDDVLGFGAATWVELSDEERILHGSSGTLFEVAAGTSASTVKVTNPDNLSFATGTNPTLRRWDGVATLTAGTPLELKSGEQFEGVQIEIDSGTFAVGDCWLIPARTRIGKVEWPRDDADPPQSIFETPHGTLHHYSLLAVVQIDGSLVFSNVSDCRRLFPPLTDITASDVGFDAGNCSNLAGLTTVQQAIDVLCRNTASDISYDPSNCANLAGATTVQQALDILCKGTGSSEEAGIRIKEVAFGDGTPLVTDTIIDAQQLVSGIRISCDRDLYQGSVQNNNGLPNPVCIVTLDLPWPINAQEREEWRAFDGYVGFHTVTVRASVNSDNNVIYWDPADDVVSSWLTNVPGVIFPLELPNILTRLTLKGDYIWGPNEPEAYLDGDVFGTPADGHVDTRYPSGDGRRGGDFELWFWLTGAAG
jgi:hypothetical protein